MKILIIGGTGHVASFLVPYLQTAGHEVVIGNRSGNSPYQSIGAVKCNGGDIKSLMPLKDKGFEVVVDFPGTALNTFEVFKETASHIIACGSLWMYGFPGQVPTPETNQKKCIFPSYEKRYTEILEMINKSSEKKAAFTAIMPPNICGPGKIPIETMGGRSIEVHKKLKNGEKVYLPEGAEALIGPCDASDIAKLFQLAIENRGKSKGQIFNAGAKYSVTASEFVNIYSQIYKTNIPVEKVSWEEYKKINPDISGRYHFYAHMLPDISKAQKLLNYNPKYSAEETLSRGVEWMFRQNLL